jgi:peroxiredoxin
VRRHLTVVGASGAPVKSARCEQERRGSVRGLAGRFLPDVTLRSALGTEVRLALITQPLVIYTYPGTDSSPGEAADAAQHKAFDRHAADLRTRTLQAIGISSETERAQRCRVARYRVEHQLWSDPALAFAAALGLPTLHDGDTVCYERLTLVARSGVIEKVFYPIANSWQCAAQIIAWLKMTGR